MHRGIGLKPRTVKSYPDTKLESTNGTPFTENKLLNNTPWIFKISVKKVLVKEVKGVDLQ
jgi:hypothetical protein